MRLSDFDYELPKELIAQEGLARRDDARLLVLEGGVVRHAGVRDLLTYFRPGDLLVLNDTRVLPSKLVGRKPTGGKLDFLLLPDPVPGGPAGARVVLIRGKKVRPGLRVRFEGGGQTLEAEVLARGAGARFQVRFDRPELIPVFASLPLPPYIKKPLFDAERYQTVYAQRAGSLAAPTAGLHFTPQLLAGLRARGVELAFVTLHVGAGTFAPITSEDVEGWKMHPEYFQVPEASARAIAAAASARRRVFAVGTTTVRTLESAAEPVLKGEGAEGWTEIYIYPGYEFRMAYCGLLTNFHLPKSTLLLLASAFAGRERILSAYREAVERRYRFFSFGDAMLLFR